MRADKAKVVDEVWDEERISSFLSKESYGNENADFSKLLHAYRSMRASDFERFIELYKASGGDVTAPSKTGVTLAETIEGHRKSSEFVAILNG